MNDQDILTEAQALIRAEGRVVTAVADQISHTFIKAVRLISSCDGLILTTGAGTSGAMAQRLTHLLATCGMRSVYMTPGDALHGESALTGPGDILIVLSKAGKSDDINQFARIAHQRGATVIVWTANPDSELTRIAQVVVVLDTDDQGEGEGVLPFGSTLANGALGDALCLMAKRLRGFDLNQLSQTHPSGGAAALVNKGSKTGK